MNYQRTQLVMMNKSGSGNVGPSVGLEAASSAGTMGAGSRRQRWRPAMEQNAAGAAVARWWVLLSPFHACCSWAPSQHELGQGAASGSGGPGALRSGCWGGLGWRLHPNQVRLRRG